MQPQATGIHSLRLGQQSTNHMCNTPWGKFRWLRLPFGLKIASDVFQERLDRVLRLLKGVHGIADDILTHGETDSSA